MIRKEQESMSLQFLLGRATVDKQGYILSEMQKRLAEDKQAQVFYLVPDHIKFEAEMSVLKNLKSTQPDSQSYTGMIRLQVFSFSRLAWYYLQDTATYNQPQLTETGLAMLIRKLLKENEENLTIYRGESNQMGFVEKLTTLFMEMRNGRVDPSDLENLLQSVSNDQETQSDIEQKLHDITLLFQAFLDQLIGKYIEKEDILEALMEEIKERDLSNTTIYIEHYQSFSAQEQALIIELAKQAKQVSVSLTLDRKHAVEPPELTDLFYEPGMAYYRLYQQSREENVAVLHDIVLTEASATRELELQGLEEYWVNSTDLSAQTERNSAIDLTKRVSVWEAENKQAEVLHAATKIRKLVASGNYRYKDILIVSRMLEDYKTVIEPVFEENNIPLFLDEPDTMAAHPLVECIQSVLLIFKRYWRYEDIMRFLRTELFVPLEEKEVVPEEREDRLAFWENKVTVWRQQVDSTENVALAYGYEGSDWATDREWIYARFHLEEMDEQLDADKQIQSIANGVKEKVRERLMPFFTQLKEANTNREAVQLLYGFLEKEGIQDQLLFWRDQAIEEGELEQARKHEQVWDAWIQLLDEFVEVLGEEEWDLDSFLTLLETGFEQETYSIVPPSIDQVMFTSFDKSRVETKKVVIMLGLTDTHLPLNQENDSILTDEDRAIFRAHLSEDKFLAPSTEAIVASEPLAAYHAFMNASDQLIFSYPMKNDGTGENRISPYISRIAEHFSLPVETKQADVSALIDGTSDEVLDFIGSRKQTLGQLVTVLRDGMDNHIQPHVFWMMLFKAMRNVEDPYENRVLYSLEHKNIPSRLSKPLAENLYGKDLYLSVSQLESFYLDPYSHFLQYGLRLRERTVQELTPAEAGNFFHEALDVIFQAIVAKNLSLEELDEQAIEEITNDVLNELYKKDKFRLLSMSNRLKFIRKQLGKTVQRMMWAIANQSRRSRMVPKKSEVLFGRLGSQTGVSGLSFPLSNGGNIHVRGKIDRLDTMEIENQLYLSVVDYKSSSHRLKFDEIYYGLMMQMLTYLDTAVEYSEDLLGKKAKPAGAFYAHVQNPYLRPKDTEKDEWISALLKKFKLNGLVVSEEEIVKQLDRTLEEGVYSLVYPINQLKSGALRGSLIKEEELDLLLKHNRQLIQEAGNRILSGENSLQPFLEKRQFTPSVGGEYKAISQFDVLLPENNYRPFVSLKKEDLMNKLMEKFEGYQSGEEDERS